MTNMITLGEQDMLLTNKRRSVEMFFFCLGDFAINQINSYILLPGVQLMKIDKPIFFLLDS